MRKARRLFKIAPLFAYQMMCQDYEQYTYPQFLDDLRRRTPKRKRKGKSPLVRFGRYSRINKLINEYQSTGNFDLLREADRLRGVITKPYRVLVKIKNRYKEYFFSALIPMCQIEELMMKINGCKTEEEVEKIVEQFDN